MLILCKYVTLRSNPLLSSSSAHVCGARHYTLPSSPLTLLPPTPRSALSPSLLSRRDGHAAAQPRRAGDRRRAPPRRLLRGGARLRAGRLPELPGLPGRLAPPPGDARRRAPHHRARPAAAPRGRRPAPRAPRPRSCPGATTSPSPSPTTTGSSPG